MIERNVTKAGKIYFVSLFEKGIPVVEPKKGVGGGSSVGTVPSIGSQFPTSRAG